MHNVLSRQVQERCRIYRLHQLPDELELACAEYGFDRLHLQGGVVGACWRRMYGVLGRQVQEHGWIYRLQELPSGLELA